MSCLRPLLKDLHNSQIEPTVIRDDNLSAICIAQNPQYHITKQIDIKYHYVREKVLDTTIELTYCLTSDMIVDILTKGLTNEFSRFRELSRLKNSQSLSEKVCWRMMYSSSDSGIVNVSIYRMYCDVIVYAI